MKGLRMDSTGWRTFEISRASINPVLLLSPIQFDKALKASESECM